MAHLYYVFILELKWPCQFLVLEKISQLQSEISSEYDPSTKTLKQFNDDTEITKCILRVEKLIELKNTASAKSLLVEGEPIASPILEPVDQQVEQDIQ